MSQFFRLSFDVISFSLVQVQAQELNFGFGPEMNTKVAFNTTQHPPPPPNTENFLRTSRQARGMKLCEHISLEQIKSNNWKFGNRPPPPSPTKCYLIVFESKGYEGHQRGRYVSRYGKISHFS